MKTIVFYAAISICLISPFPVFADEKQVLESITISEAVNLAVRWNPELKAAEKEIDVALARAVQVKLFPNPTLFMETEDGEAGSFGFGEDYKSVIGFSQSLPLGGKLKAQKTMAELEREIAALNYELKLREKIGEIKKTFILVLASRELESIAKDNLEIADNLYDAASSRVDAYAAPETERIRAEIELSRAQIALSRARKEYYHAEKHLHALMGNTDIYVNHYTGSLRDDFPIPHAHRMEEKVILSSPEIVLAKKHEELSGTRFQLARAKRFPDIEIGVGTGKERGLIENRNTLEWSIQIPLPLFNRNQGEVLESEILIVKAKREYEDALNTMRLQAKQILSAFENSLNQVRTYSKKVLPQAERSLALTLEGYNAGKFTSIDLLEAQRTLVETREIFVHLLQELNDNAIEIERMTGVSIEELQ